MATMSGFMRDTIVRSKTELRLAIAEHDAAYLDGDWQSAGDRIDSARCIADAAIYAIGLWPSGKRYLGNDTALDLLQKAAGHS
jgi:hypothetical protein